ncbi:MAG: LysM peptidoglycan-binding domain-containing protein [Cytophagaceae bacterium]|nr:LysM peptidoglycan-binding domain-containing protein [Gemmatimonadaceae bacterium]
MTNPREPSADFSNVRSGSSSDAMSRDEATARPEARMHTVVKGDTLSKIAKEYYGDASKWKAIHEANRDLIANPDLIQIGWELTIPQL